MIYTSADAQVRVSINANIGRQPVWGPAGYDYAQYYYLPDIDVYYDIQSTNFIYQDCGRWVTAAALPVRYHNYNLYSGYKVVVNDQRPYMHHEYYRNKYAGYRNYHGRQVVIRDSRDKRYVIVNRNYNKHNGRVIVMR